jgi:hypothetical protein
MSRCSVHGATSSGVPPRDRAFVQSPAFCTKLPASTSLRSLHRLSVAAHREHIFLIDDRHGSTQYIGRITMVNLPGKNLINQIVQRGVRAVVPARRQATAAATPTVPTNASPTAGSL